MKDSLGNEIKFGDLLCYGVGRGNIAFALVLGFKEMKDQYGWRKEFTKIQIKWFERREEYIKSWDDCNKDDKIFSAEENKKYYIEKSATKIYLNGMGNYIVVPLESVQYQDLREAIEKEKALLVQRIE